MTADLKTGILLLFVGMITVFIVLGIVMLTGKVLIYFVDRISREKIISERKPKTTRTPEHAIAPWKIAAIAAAVSVVTGGKALPVSIQKIE